MRRAGFAPGPGGAALASMLVPVVTALWPVFAPDAPVRAGGRLRAGC